MHDHGSARAYVPDTEVVDVDEWRDRQPAPQPDRAPPRRLGIHEDLTVQILLDDGLWHRPAAGKAGEGKNGIGRVACGQGFPHRHQHKRRHEIYEDDMCTDGCFSEFELSEANDANHAARDNDERTPQ